MVVEQKANKIFEPLWKNQSRYVICMGGRGTGRSTAGSQFILSQLLAPEFFRCAIMRAIHGDIRHSLWRELNDRIDEQKIREALRITDNDMKIEYGQNTINAHGFKASSGSHSAKLKSLANYNTVVIEEAEEIGEQEFMTLDDSLRTVKGDIKIVMLLNPPAKNHWIIRRFFNLKNSEQEGFYIPEIKPDVNAIHIGGNWKNNSANLDSNTKARYEDYKNTKPNYYCQMIVGLVPEVVRGKIFNGWELIDNIPQEARLVRFGEDYGWFPDPACAVALYYWNGGYIVDELAYGTHLTNEFLAGKIKEVGSALTVADSAEPKSIEEQKNKYGLNIVGSEKGADSVEYGIKVVSQKRIYVTRRSKNVWDSYENYAWKEDKDGNPLGEPCHEWKHAMDAIVYPLVSLSQPEKGKMSIHRPQWSGFNRR